MKPSDQKSAEGGKPAGTENTTVGGNLAENNNRGSGKREPQGEGKINAGTDIPAQGIENANKEAEAALLQQGEGSKTEGETKVSEAARAGNAGMSVEELKGREGRTAFDGGKTQQEIEASKGQSNFADEAAKLGQKTSSTAGEQNAGTEAGEAQRPSLGHHRIRPDFNPDHNGKVTAIKQLGAQAVDEINSIDVSGLSGFDAGEFARLKATALTNIEAGIMWAVKAATYKSAE